MIDRNIVDFKILLKLVGFWKILGMVVVVGVELLVVDLGIVVVGIIEQVTI